MRKNRFISLLLILALALGLCACGKSADDPGTSVGAALIQSAVKLYVNENR